MAQVQAKLKSSISYYTDSSVNLIDSEGNIVEQGFQAKIKAILAMDAEVRSQYGDTYGIAVKSLQTSKDGKYTIKATAFDAPFFDFLTKVEKNGLNGLNYFEITELLKLTDKVSLHQDNFKGMLSDLSKLTGLKALSVLDATFYYNLQVDRYQVELLKGKADALSGTVEGLWQDGFDAHEKTKKFFDEKRQTELDRLDAIYTMDDSLMSDKALKIKNDAYAKAYGIKAMEISFNDKI